MQQHKRKMATSREKRTRASPAGTREISSGCPSVAQSTHKIEPFWNKFHNNSRIPKKPSPGLQHTKLSKSLIFDFCIPDDVTSPIPCLASR
uniref:Ovule protein n=1 Tax=Steinernema glaseri TaxID=37863 RepID=A0A1I7ZRY6_9BILA